MTIEIFSNCASGYRMVTLDHKVERRNSGMAASSFTLSVYVFRTLSA